MEREKELRKKILDLVKEYHGVKFGGKKFEKGKSPVRYAGRVFDEKELQLLVDSSLDFWLTLGQEGIAFENSKIAKIRQLDSNG